MYVLYTYLNYKEIHLKSFYSLFQYELWYLLMMIWQDFD